MKVLHQYMALLITCVLLCTGCEKYLDVQPKGKQLLVTASDYDQWLNSENLTYETNAFVTVRFTDLYDVYPFNLMSSSAADLEYRWAPQFNDAATTPDIWSGFYASIYYYNTVINGIDDVKDASSQRKQSLKAEALLGRAFEYFYLVNLYGKPYNPATAAQDLAVPFVQSSDIVTDVPPRSTVQDMYNHIIADLKQAVTALPEDNVLNRFRGSVAAANSMLARTYFYMGDYVNAQKYAELALTAPSLGMIDYNSGITSPSAYPNWPLLATRKDVIFARGAGNRSTVATIPIPLSYYNSFASGDLRFYFIKDNRKPTLSPDPKRGTINYVMAYPSLANNTGNGNNANIGPSVSEMKLIIAEAAARSGDITTALQQLDDVRKNRFDPTSYQKFISDDKVVVLNKVLDERTFELPFVGLRWLDMRRLNAEGKMPAVQRYDNTNTVFATLNPNDPRYVLQIPLNALRYNPNMPQNP